MMKKLINVVMTLAVISLFGCAGGGGGPQGPSITSQSVTWGADHVTRTTVSTYSDGTSTTQVATIEPTETPTYSGNQQTIVTTYGDGTTATATNTATSSAVTWGADHVTRTTTYTFANGGTNPVVETVPGTNSTPTLTAATYPANWTTVGVVTPPSVSSKVTTYGDGHTVTVEDGSSPLPFLQTTLSAQSITDPNKFVSSSTATYDLRWGTPDKDGPSYSAIFSDGAVNYVTASSALNFWGYAVTGQCSGGPANGYCLNGAIIATPHPEVLEAWRNGWTGKGVNVMIEDYLSGSSKDHGVTTTMLAQRYAIGSNFYGYNVPTGLGVYNLDGTVNPRSSQINLGVVNASFGANLSSIIGRSGPWTASELSNAAISFSSASSTVINRYTGIQGWSNVSYLDAVIVKAAGNDSGLTADNEPLNNALANNSNINSRLLIVGALTSTGSVASPASIANYSNTAGTSSVVKDRFLVASGNTPFGDGWLALNGVPIDGTSIGPDGQPLSGGGTSFAAPRVAGYAAILRQKFSNLDASSSASIILDTARTDTISNYNSNVHGKGEASLSRALAPVGRLR
jgi:hypothetical protein